MSSLSSFQRITNDMLSYERTSDHKVKSEHYFSVRVESHNQNFNMTEFAKKDLVAKYVMGAPIMCVYVYHNTAYILFSSTDNKPHYLNGSHHELCSHYASNASIFTGSHTKCSITEFDSRTKILIYFQTKVFENMKESMVRLSGVTINKKEASTLTQTELIEALDKRAAIKWDSAPAGDRFGTFYKFTILPNGTKKFSVMSELFDSKNMEKYSSYMFG